MNYFSSLFLTIIFCSSLQVFSMESRGAFTREECFFFINQACQREMNMHGHSPTREALSDFMKKAKSGYQGRIVLQNILVQETPPLYGCFTIKTESCTGLESVLEGMNICDPDKQPLHEKK